MKKSISIIGALSISLFIYLFYRSERTVVNEWAISIGPLGTYQWLKSIIKTTLPLPSAIIYSLPGGLWLFCVTVLSKTFYLQIQNLKLQLVYVPLAFAIGLELCQLVHITQGRFDVWDVVSYIVFWLLARYLFKSNDIQQNIWSPFTLQGLLCLACFVSVYLAHVNA